MARPSAMRHVASCYSGFRSLLTSCPNNACDSTRYAEIPRTERRDVWHGAARTNGPYISRKRVVNCKRPPPSSPLLPHHVQFGVRGLLMNRMTGNRACHVALCRYKYMLLYFLLHLGWLCCLKTQSIFWLRILVDKLKLNQNCMFTFKI